MRFVKKNIKENGKKEQIECIENEINIKEGYKQRVDILSLSQDILFISPLFSEQPEKKEIILLFVL